LIEVHGVYQQKREDVNTFVCAVALYVAETPKALIKDHEPPLPIIPFCIVAYGFVGQPFSKQLFIILYMYRYLTQNSSILPVGSQDVKVACFFSSFNSLMRETKEYKSGSHSNYKASFILQSEQTT